MRALWTSLPTYTQQVCASTRHRPDRQGCSRSRLIRYEASSTYEFHGKDVTGGRELVGSNFSMTTQCYPYMVCKMKRTKLVKYELPMWDMHVFCGASWPDISRSWPK